MLSDGDEVLEIYTIFGGVFNKANYSFPLLVF